MRVRDVLTAIGATVGLTFAFVTAAHAVKVGPVDDPLGVVKVMKNDPVVIGGTWVMSGADTALGVDSKRGVEVYFKQIGDKIKGHPIRFIVEDDGCNAEGGQTAGTKLAANQQMIAVLGSACSSVCTVTAPILWKQGITQLGTACSAPKLTAADRGPQYDGLVRTIPSDAEQAKNDAKWMFDVMKWKNVASIHDGSPYAQQLVASFKENFVKMGGKMVAEEAISPTDVDMRPVLTRIAATKPDVVYYPIFVAAGGQITRQGKEIPGLEKANFISGGSMMAKDFIIASGPNIVGMRITFPDVSPEALGKDYPKLVEQYKKQFGEEPIQGFHAHAYDAAKLLHLAIEKVAVQDKDGTLYIGRKALRDAVFNLPAFDGMAGTVKCDQHGQCAAFKFAVYQFNNADPETFKPGVNPKKIYSGEKGWLQ